MYKKYSDSTLLSLPKRELLLHLRAAEHNRDAAEKTLEQQAENMKDWQPVRHGHWIDVGNDEWECSNCGVATYADEDYIPTDTRALKMYYCHYCGAKMDEEVNK